MRLDQQTILVDKGGGQTAAGAPSGLMIIGDSGMFDAAPAIGAVFQHAGTPTVVDASFPGFGWSRNPKGWKSDYPKLVADSEVTLSVVMLGGWDIQYVKGHGDDAYDRLLDDAVAVLAANGGHVVWIGMMPDDKTSVDEIDKRFHALAERHPDTVAFVRIDSVLRARDGRYPRWLPGPDGHTDLIRKPDGWHLCPDGSVRVADVVAKVAAARGWAPALTPGWEQGNWRTSGRFDDPPSGCDPAKKDNQPR
jgi:hypothetical protein